MIQSPSEMNRVQAGDILVTDMTDPNWEPVMKRASAIVTNRGGRTCHAAIIARRARYPGARRLAMQTEVLCESMCRRRYRIRLSGKRPRSDHHDMGNLEIPVKTRLNVGNPELAFESAQIPNGGVGLVRLGVRDQQHRNSSEGDPRTGTGARQPARGRSCVVRADTLRRSNSSSKNSSKVLATIAAAFLSAPGDRADVGFRRTRYRKLLSGEIYEPKRKTDAGIPRASRYIAPAFRDRFSR